MGPNSPMLCSLLVPILIILSLFSRSHHDNCVLLAGKGSPTQPLGQRYAINYHSIFDNKILRKFKGHSDAVTSISMCPADDTFLSSSRDRTVRLWDVKEAGCLAELKLPENAVGDPLAVFDSTGLVFAVTAAMADQKGHYVHLYDARNYNGGAFAELCVSQTDLQNAIQSQVSTTPARAAEMSRGDWKSIEFNLSGNQILIGADQGVSLLLDGFEGSIQRVLVPPGSNYSRPAVTCFTPDDKTVLVGHEDGSITCWDVDTGAIVNTLKGHSGGINCLAANPKYAQIASSCTHTALWIW
jgi:COMPASS component SWD2